MAPDDLDIVEMRVSGQTLHEIASVKGVHESTISRRLQRADLAEKVEQLKSELINEGLHIAKGNIIH